MGGGRWKNGGRGGRMDGRGMKGQKEGGRITIACCEWK